MPLIEPAIVTLLEPALLAVTAPDLIEPTSVPDDPGPGDPGTPWVPPAVSRRGLRIQVMLCRTVTHEIVGELRSAYVEDWADDVEEPTSATITASSWDPMWEAVADGHVTYRGVRRYRWDAKAYEVLICLDGTPVWVGVFRQPLDIGGGLVALNAKSPEILLDDRPLGPPEAIDLLDGWGDFERYAVGSTPPGIAFFPRTPGAPMTAVIVADDSIRGGHALEITGDGYVRTPIVDLQGQEGVGRTVAVSGFGKWPPRIPSGVRTILTETQRADSLTPENPDDTIRKAGLKPDSGTRWSDQPVSSGATMSESAVIHHTWGKLRSFSADHPSRYDVVRMQQGVLSGFLETHPYSDYVRELFTDYQHGEGGSSIGVTTRIEEETDAGVQLTWNHNGHPRMREAMSMVDTNVDGGAAWKINPAWVCRIKQRHGRDRTDEILIGPDQIVDPRWAQDPGAEIDEYVADTGRGAGTSLLVSTLEQPVTLFRHRIAAEVRPPDGTLNATDAWTRRHGEIAARKQVTGEWAVRWELARLLVAGDTVSTLPIDGLLTEPGPMNIVRIRFRPWVGLGMLTMGAAT